MASNRAVYGEQDSDSEYDNGNKPRTEHAIDFANSRFEVVEGGRWIRGRSPEQGHSGIGVRLHRTRDVVLGASSGRAECGERP